MTKIWISEGIEIYPATEITVVDTPLEQNWEWDVPDELVKKWMESASEYGQNEKAILDYVEAHPECANQVLKQHRIVEQAKSDAVRVEQQRQEKRMTRILLTAIAILLFIGGILVVAELLGLNWM